MNLELFRQTLNRAVLDKLPELTWISQLEGMGSPWTQHVLNVSCWCLKQTKEAYVEVGAWHGASFDAASKNCDDVNKVVCERGVYEDLRTLVKATPNTTLVEGDFFESELPIPMGSVGAFYYDGYHSLAATVWSFDKIKPYLADRAILLMDDLCYDSVFKGWRIIGMKEGVTIVHEFWPAQMCDEKNWWNGFGIAEFTRS